MNKQIKMVEEYQAITGQEGGHIDLLRLGLLCEK